MFCTNMCLQEVQLPFSKPSAKNRSALSLRIIVLDCELLADWTRLLIFVFLALIQSRYSINGYYMKESSLILPLEEQQPHKMATAQNDTTVNTAKEWMSIRPLMGFFTVSPHFSSKQFSFHFHVLFNFS